MKRFILTTAAVAFALVFGSTASLEAAPNHGGGHAPAHAHVVHGHAPAHAHAVAHGHVAPRANVHVVHSYGHRSLVVHGRSVNVRYYGRGYHGWNYRCWFPGYRTYGYYGDGGWYYWYAPFDEYLPITYMAVYPPTVAVAPVTVLPMTTGVPVSPALPPGATLVPGPITTPY